MEKRKRISKKKFFRIPRMAGVFVENVKGVRSSGKEGRWRMKGEKNRFEKRFSSLADREIRI